MQASYLDGKAANIAEIDVIVLEESTSVAEAVKTMRRKGVSSVFVSRGGSLVGIVTERDILYRVVAESRGPFKTILRDVMSSPLVSIDGQATVRQAVSIMRQKGIRRLPVMDKGQAVGVVTLKAVVGNIPGQSIELAEVDVPAATVSCPYCGSHFEGKDDLSKHIDRLHIDRLHIGSGLLEGDIRQL
jgi:CBS domain-containing protein